VPRDSIGRRVARAASIGGSRSYKSRTPYGWYSIVLAVCLIGLGLIVFSRHERQQAAANPSTTTTTAANTVPPLITDHWQVALSVDICGKIANLPKSADQTSGIITAGNGVVDIEPARALGKASEFEGANATLGKFLTAEGVTLTNTSLKLPSSVGKLAGTYVSSRKCGAQPGEVRVLIWGTPTATAPFPATNAAGVTYANGELFMVAFVPKTASVPRPPAYKVVAAFLKSQTTTTTTAPTTTTTTKPKGSTTTTKPNGSTTTTKPQNTTTTAPQGTTSTTG
jgi:hypothetical protein